MRNDESRKTERKEKDSGGVEFSQWRKVDEEKIDAIYNIKQITIRTDCLARVIVSPFHSTGGIQLNVYEEIKTIFPYHCVLTVVQNELIVFIRSLSEHREDNSLKVLLEVMIPEEMYKNLSFKIEDIK